jgi:hypothetical protein
LISAQQQKVVGITPPAAIIDNAAATTAFVDTLGFDYLTVYVYFGAMDIAVSAMKLQESDVSSSGYVDITGADFSAALPSATADLGIYAFFVSLASGRKRYVDLSLTLGDGAAGTFVTAWAQLTRGKAIPETATDRGLAAQLIVV